MKQEIKSLMQIYKTLSSPHYQSSKDIYLTKLINIVDASETRTITNNSTDISTSQ